MARGSLSFHFSGNTAMASNWSILLSGTQTPRPLEFRLVGTESKHFPKGSSEVTVN